MIGSITVTALVAIGTLLIGHFSGAEARILLTTLALAVTSGLSLGGASSWPKQRTLPILGVALAVVAFLAALPPIWLKGIEGDKGWEPWVRTVGIAYVLAAAVTYATLLILRRRAGEGAAVRNTRLAALASLAWLAAMISLLIASFRFSGPGYGRVLTAAAILTVATTLVTLILQRLEAPVRSEVLSTGAVAGRTIVSVEKRKGKVILVLDDGRRLPLARDLKLE
jgi:hypothetical protein